MIHFSLAYAEARRHDPGGQQDRYPCPGIERPPALTGRGEEQGMAQPLLAGGESGPGLAGQA
jgi:hypothetical protein